MVVIGWFSPHEYSDEEADDEDTYKMAGVMSECKGLEIILHR